MLPSDTSINGANGNGSASGQSTPPVKDTRSFQYRFSMGYVRSLPEAQRPVEREMFGKSVSWNTPWLNGPPF
jgi:CD2 antigen cytoplasmic tail-binding protein 2